MRVALVSSVSSPVRQHAGGSVEAWTWLLARELHRLGHEPTVFGCDGADVAGEFIATQPGPYGTVGSFDDWQLCEWVNLCRAVQQSRRFDILHTQAYLWGIPLEQFSNVPMVHTLHIVPDDNHLQLWRSSPASHVTAVSHHQWSAHPELTPAAVIHHGVDVEEFDFRSQPEDYLLYLGRFTSGKGPWHAIKTAKDLGLRLILAGPENGYFREKVRPLVDGRSVEYVGAVNARERNRLLGGARALLYPIQYPEAFGLVLVEAMLCGTPVAALRQGAVPELVHDGVSGYSAETLDELIQIVPKTFQLDRQRVRQWAMEHFSAERMARDYLRVYEQIVAKG